MEETGLYLETEDVNFAFFTLTRWIKDTMPCDGVFFQDVPDEILFNHPLLPPQDTWSCNQTNLGLNLLCNEALCSGSVLVPKDPNDATSLKHVIGQDCKNVQQYFPIMAFKNDEVVEQEIVKKQQEYLGGLTSESHFKHVTFATWKSFLGNELVQVEKFKERQGDSFYTWCAQEIFNNL